MDDDRETGAEGELPPEVMNSMRLDARARAMGAIPAEQGVQLPSGEAFLEALLVESHGRLGVAELRISFPEGKMPPGGLRADDLRAISLPALIRDAQEVDEAVRRGDLDAMVQEAAEWAESRPEYQGLAETIRDPEVVAWLRDLPPQPDFLDPEARKRLSQPGWKRQGHSYGSDFYARVALHYLRVLRSPENGRRPIAYMAESYQAEGWQRATVDVVRSWVDTAEGREGFLTDRTRGRAGANPTDKLREWVERNPDVRGAKWFKQTYGETQERGE